MKPTKLLHKALNSPRNLRFAELQQLAMAFGFVLDRISGSHYIFTHDQIPELVNLQNYKGKAKPYQIKQFIDLVERYNLQLGDGQ
jgi:predicted RNA binding protein YcfA (HicA-like mRNA interferase family)